MSGLEIVRGFFPREMKGLACGRAYNRQNPIYPSISHPLSHKSENKWSHRHPQCDHHCPDTHVLCAFAAEERLRDDGTTDCHGRRDEKRHQGTTCCHRRIVRALRTTDIADTAEEQREEENRTASEAMRERFPEQRSTAQDGDLERSEIAHSLKRNPEV